MPRNRCQIKVRVTAEMKARVMALASEREETESAIVRAALVAYMKRHRPRSADLGADANHRHPTAS